VSDLTPPLVYRLGLSPTLRICWSIWHWKKPGVRCLPPCKRNSVRFSTDYATYGAPRFVGWRSVRAICPSARFRAASGRWQSAKPRIDHRKLRVAEGWERFSSAIMSRFMRRIPSLEALIPQLYLQGISTGDFGEVLWAILGEGAKGLSTTNITRLREYWLGKHR
jgi:hypothetical protein